MDKNNPNTPDFLTQLVSAAGQENTLLEDSACLTYGYDNSKQISPPDAVVFATDEQQIASIVKLCNHFNKPITARGMGTGTSGGSIPANGGIILSMEKMNQITTIDVGNRFANVQPGVINHTLQNELATKGFFWPPDPTSASYCTIGGNLANNSAGPKAVKYGTPRDNVLGLKAVLGDGKIIKTGVFTTKGVVGYDLTRLIIGSEGTLAIITEATLKLTPTPLKKATVKAIYQSINGVTQAIVAIMSQPNTPCALEFIDDGAIQLIRKQFPDLLPANAQALLMIEVDGDEESIDFQLANIKNAANNDDALDIKSTSQDQERQELWRARKSLSPILRTFAPNKINEDVVVPITHIPKLIDGLKKISTDFNIPIINFGHAGNGNIHVNLLYNANNADHNKKIEPCLTAVFNLVLQLNGTLSGEHGIGLVKKDYVAYELSNDAIELMQKIKLQFDPNNILNPGKLFPSTLYETT